MTEPAASIDWQLAKVAAFRDETARVRTVVFDLPHWPGHLAGQHVDVRLTSEDGYQAERSYSIASAAGMATEIELTIERIDDGEISPFLTEDLVVGDTIEIRGPIGGYFTWQPTALPPLMLIAGGSGVVPLMSMLRTRHNNVGSPVPGRLLYSSRTVDNIIYRDELAGLVEADHDLEVVHTLTRGTPADWKGESRRVDAAMLARHTFPVVQQPQIFVCGPTPFVETVADQLIALGHNESAVKTERFGPTGR